MLNKTPTTKSLMRLMNGKYHTTEQTLLPPIGAAKLQDTPTAQAAASISLFLDSFS